MIGLRERIQTRTDKDEKGFVKLIYGFKARNVECLLSWLQEEVRPFVDRRKSGRGRTSPKGKTGEAP